jgi:hypothetical protein
MQYGFDLSIVGDYSNPRLLSVLAVDAEFSVLELGLR